MNCKNMSEISYSSTYSCHEVVAPNDTSEWGCAYRRFLSNGSNPENPLIAKSGDTVCHCSSESIVYIQNSITPLDFQWFKEYVTLSEDCEASHAKGGGRRNFEFVSPRSIPGGIAPGFSHVGMMPDDAAGRRCFLEDLPLLPPLHSNAAPYSPRFNLIGSQDLGVKSRPKLPASEVSERRGSNGLAARVLAFHLGALFPAGSPLHFFASGNRTEQGAAQNLIVSRAIEVIEILLVWNTSNFDDGVRENADLSEVSQLSHSPSTRTISLLGGFARGSPVSPDHVGQCQLVNCCKTALWLLAPAACTEKCTSVCKRQLTLQHFTTRQVGYFDAPPYSPRSTHIDSQDGVVSIFEFSLVCTRRRNIVEVEP
ncbi:hypothetical protein PR048_001059 [Dryococelus australis]|uniref:Uncharacterized protein n=1 Tax=Dryococelus australis TaxID=614101 RepID=A0ABQ9IGE4_9NEOP|nr:hypothetical protein PR048_001059 [Dryococelus australis]